MSDGPTPASSGARIFGIRAKLFLAFSALAGLAVVASAVAWYAFIVIGGSVARVTDDSIPGMVNALALAKTGTEIAASAPAIMSAGSQDELAAQETALDEKLHRFLALSESLDRHIADSASETQLADLARQLVTRLADLGRAVDRRLALQRQREAANAAMLQSHTHFLETLEPLVDDAVFDLVMSGERVMDQNSEAITGLVDEGVSGIDHLLAINAAANLAAGLMAEAINVDDTNLLKPIEERFVSAALAIERHLDQLPANETVQHLKRAADALLAPGIGPDNVFDGGIGQTFPSVKLKARHDDLLLILTPMIDDAAFDLVLDAEKTTAHSERAIAGLIQGGVSDLTVLLTLHAEGNLMASLLSETAGAPSRDLLRPLGERYATTRARIERLLDELPQTISDGGLGRATRHLVGFGDGLDGMFVLRGGELDEIHAGQTALDASQALSVRLGDHVAALVTAAEAESGDAARHAIDAIDTGRLVMVFITILSVAGAILVMFRYVDPRVVRPVEHITTAMTDLAEGDTDVDIPGRDRNDELGRMAQALGVFRDTAIAVQKANLREIETARRHLADAINSISEGFSLYDSDDRLVVCNRRYQELLYPDMAEPIEPGATFESIIRRTVKEGYVRDSEGDNEAWIAERLARHRTPGSPHVQQRSDGRYIMVSERGTEEGGTVAVYSDITELKERETQLARKSTELEQLAGQLAKYLSPQVYESIFSGRQEVKVESQRKKLTVFFSDIADFTETTEKLESEDLTRLLNQYLTEMSKIALHHGATVDKYVGDAIVIFFGDPDTRGVQEDALACVEMAIDMRRRMIELQADWRDTGIEKPLTCRMGINTGYCTVGNFGSEARMDYTIIGAGVNLASRLESSATPGEIVISYETHAWIKDRILCEADAPITVKGIARPVATYRVVDTFERLGQKGGIVREDQTHLRLDMNVAAMSDKEREAAEAALRDALDRVVGDPAAGRDTA